MPRSWCSTLLAALLLPAAAAAADLPPTGGLADVAGPRALAIAAPIGAVVGGDALFVNPAAIAARRRVSFETLYYVDRRGDVKATEAWGLSAVDALTSRVAFGVAYLRGTEGPEQGDIFHLALATPIANGLLAGAEVRKPNLTGAERITSWVTDFGLLWELSDLISIGGVATNVFGSRDNPTVPRTWGAGLTLGSDTRWRLAADWRSDLDRAGRTTNQYGVGGEYLVGSFLPLRAGWLKDETLDTTWWTAGFGLVSQGGVALDVGLRQSLDSAQARSISVGLKLFFNE